MRLEGWAARDDTILRGSPKRLAPLATTAEPLRGDDGTHIHLRSGRNGGLR
jgi:hypothetical protein